MTYIKYYNLLLFSLLCSCSTTNAYKVNPEKLQFSFSDYIFLGKQYSPPTIVRWGHNTVKLSYIAASHEIDFRSKTFKLIREEIDLLQPEVIVVESFSKRWDSFYQRGRCSHWMKQKLFEPGESNYVSCIGKDKNILIRPAEPSNIETINKLREKYSQQDFTYFFVSRGIRAWNQREKVVNAESFKKYVNGYLERNCKAYDFCSDNFTYENYLLWMEQKLSIKFNFNNHTNGTLTTPVGGGTFLQKLSADIGLVRELSIVKTIEDVLNNYNRILIVYGAGHLYQEQFVLQDMLGNPIGW